MVGLAYPRLDECRVDAMASLPSLAQLDRRVASGYDAILIGCTKRLMLSPAFRARLSQLGGTAPLIAVVPPDPRCRSPGREPRFGWTGRAGSHTASARADDRGSGAREKALPSEHAERLGPDGLPPLVGGRRRRSYADPKQEQIVELIAQGATDREVAMALRISESTIHKQVQNALRRPKARTRSQLVAAARRPPYPGSFGP